MLVTSPSVRPTGNTGCRRERFRKVLLPGHPGRCVGTQHAACGSADGAAVAYGDSGVHGYAMIPGAALSRGCDFILDAGVSLKVFSKSRDRLLRAFSRAGRRHCRPCLRMACVRPHARLWQRPRYHFHRARKHRGLAPLPCQWARASISRVGSEKLCIWALPQACMAAGL